MNFDLTDKQTYWRDRIRDHNERFLRPRVADYYAEQAVGDRWKVLQEFGVVIKHGADLRLLQHDFGQPDSVRVLGVLPGQALPAMLALPVHHLAGKALWQCDQGF